MNEIATVHLGRQPFNVSVDAHKILQAYLAAIKHQAGDSAKDVVEEVESRMAELLTERGITGDKVVLVEDVDYLKKQLGEPSDFQEVADTDQDTPEVSDTPGPKRLFRDTGNGMLAGVAAGLSAYLGIPVLIIRLVFIALVLSGGAGILVYLLLWLLVPEARSPSDYLQMKGQAITVDSIKQVVNRADVPGAAQRAGHIVGRTGDRLTRLILAVLGIGFILGSIGLLAISATAASYLLLHGAQITSITIFPVGTKETYLAICGLAALVLIAVMLAITGRAILTRKWTFPNWALAAIITLFVAAASIGTALGLAVGPTISQRYDRLQHTQTRVLPSFKDVQIQGNNIPVSFQPDTSYSVELRSLGNTSTQGITVKVVNGTLKIDTSHSRAKTTCSGICFGGNDVEIIVHAPSYFNGVEDKGDGNFIKAPPYPPQPQLPQ